jgi:hypothetical protein
VHAALEFLKGRKPNGAGGLTASTVQPIVK